MDMQMVVDASRPTPRPAVLQSSAERQYEFVTYDPYDREHKAAFIKLLMQHAEIHGVDGFSEDIARICAEKIGDQGGLDVTFMVLNSGPKNLYLSMMIEGDALALGPAALFEDLVVDRDFQGRSGAKIAVAGLASNTAAGGKFVRIGEATMRDSIMRAYDNGKTSVVFSAAQSNTVAFNLFRRIDSGLEVANLHDVWQISGDMIARIAGNESLPDTASVAISYDEGAGSLSKRVKRIISDGLKRFSADLTEDDRLTAYDAFSDIMRHQAQTKLFGNGNGRSTAQQVLHVAGNSFSQISAAKSTFLGMTRRTDVRLSIDPNEDVSNVLALVKIACKEMVHNNWRGNIYIENAGPIAGLTQAEKINEVKTAAKINEALKMVGATVVTHRVNNRVSPMQSVNITGKRLIQSVVDSVAYARKHGLRVPIEHSRLHDLRRDAANHSIPCLI